MKRQYSRGFTLVELLIVIVIIAILAAITIIAYNGITNRAKDSAVRSAAAQLVTVIQDYALQYGSDSLKVGASTVNPVSNGVCSEAGTGGWIKSPAYKCTLQDVLVSSGKMNSNFFNSIPASTIASGASSPTYTFMFYPCPAGYPGMYILYYNLISPSSDDTAKYASVLASCGMMAPTTYSQYVNYNMRGAILINAN